MPDIRISNTERESAVSALGVHLSTGRLEMSEYEERCGQAAMARTRGELEALFTDLPAPHPDLSSATSPGQLMAKAGELVTRPARTSKELEETPASEAFQVIAGLAAVLGIPGAILLTIFAGAWWVFFPVVGVLIFAGALSESLKKKPAPGS